MVLWKRLLRDRLNGLIVVVCMNLQVTLEYPDEHLISISGHVSSYIRSLTFESNKRRYGPFGSRRGLPFSLPPMGRKIVGFYGKSGRLVDAIGVYLKPLKQIINPLDFVVLAQNQIETSNGAEISSYEYEGQESIRVEEADVLGEDEMEENREIVVRMIKID